MIALRYAIIGCGSMGREHIHCIQALEGAQISAIADPYKPSLEAASALISSKHLVFEDYTELLASSVYDVLVISTPNHTHIDLMRLALKTSVPILVEKPLCTNIDDCIELVRLSAKRTAMVWVAHEYRFMPPVAEMLRMAKAGAVGRIHQVAIREHREPFYSKVGDWNRFNQNTGGTLVEKCCHYFNLMDLILQEKPLSFYASGGQRVNHLSEAYQGRYPDVLDSAFVIVNYPSGARAMLDLCMFAESTVDKEQISVVGDEGKLESLLPSLTLRYGQRKDFGVRTVWDPSNKHVHVEERRVSDKSIRYEGAHFGATYIQHKHFVSALRSGQMPQISMEEGMRAVASGLAAQLSIQTGRVIGMNEILSNNL
jgi:myo-inositol 2-dehydrogenase / D-chiro-inositol 1-dehydrogenase